MPTSMTRMPQLTTLQGIEIFREGTHVDDAGERRTFTRADVDAMAAVYDPKLHDAPVCVGHPAHDEPRFGHAAKLRAVDGTDGKRTLVMDAADVLPAFAEAAVEKRLFPKRSTAFYSPNHPKNPKPGSWYVRHVGFLGAQPPAIRGLADLPRLPQYADEGADLVCFSESASATTTEDQRMDEELKAQLAAEKAAREKAEADAKAANEALATAHKKARDTRHAENVQFAEGALKAGKLKADEVGEVVALLDLAGDAEVVQFGEGDKRKDLAPVPLIRRLVERAGALANMTETAGGEVVQFAEGSARGKSDADIDKAAKAYAAKHNVSYSEALDKVVSFTGA